MVDLTRRQVRYWCFRFRTATEPDGNPAKGAPSGLRKRMEADPHFPGWESFGMTWDIDDAGRIVPLRHTLEQTWNTEAYASARDLPKE